MYKLYMRLYLRSAYEFAIGVLSAEKRNYRPPRVQSGSLEWLA